jgi:GntR family transcriptional regulator
LPIVNNAREFSMNDSLVAVAAVPAPRPLYVQVRELMIGRLIQGVWKPGAVLPSEVQLAEEFGVSQGTVRKALDALAAENLVIRRQGRGTFVAEHDDERTLFHFFHLVGEDGSRQMPGGTQLSCRAGKASRAEALRLDIERGAGVIRLRRTRDLGGMPAIYESISVPAILYPNLGGEGVLPNTLYELYESRYGITIARAEERLRAVEAPAEAAVLLGIAPGAPVLEIDRVAFALDGRPAEWRVSLCDTRHHHYLAELV